MPSVMGSPPKISCQEETGKGKLPAGLIDGCIVEMDSGKSGLGVVAH